MQIHHTPLFAGEGSLETVRRLKFSHRSTRGEHESRQVRAVSGRHKSSSEKWRSEDLAANFHNTGGFETHCRRARLPFLGEKHSAGLRAASSRLASLLAEE